MSRRGTRTWSLTCTAIALVGVVVSVLAWPSVASVPGGDDPGGAGGGLKTGLAVESFIGKVELRGSDGRWKGLRTGQVLREGAVIRTGAFSRGMLRAWDGSKFAVKPNSFITVGADDEAKSRFVLTEGRVAADIPRQEGRAVEIAASKGDARAETKGGRFQVVANREGLLGVTTEKGKVDLIARGERVTVSAGKQAVALAGAPPTNPAAIPAQVFLRVKWPEGETSEKVVAVSGVTSQGSVVRVADETLAIRPDGSFEGKVRLAKGENHVAVIAEDLSGRIRRMDSPAVIRKDPEPKALKLQVTTKGNIWE